MTDYSPELERLSESQNSIAASVLTLADVTGRNQKLRFRAAYTAIGALAVLLLICASTLYVRQTASTAALEQSSAERDQQFVLNNSRTLCASKLSRNFFSSMGALASVTPPSGTSSIEEVVAYRAELARRREAVNVATGKFNRTQELCYGETPSVDPLEAP